MTLDATSATPVDKLSLVAQLRSHLEQELADLERSVRAASDAAISEESKAENKYDTRGLEASYLAGAQQDRLTGLQRMLALLNATVLRTYDAHSKIAAGALVALDQDGVRSLCFLMPVGAGQQLQLAGAAVLTVTTHSPLGKALIGKSCDDEITLKTPQGVKTYTVLSVR